MSINDRPLKNTILYNESGTAVGEAIAYSASIVGLSAANSATDIFTIIGSASKTVKVTRITLGGTQTTASSRDVLIIKRSTADTGGTSTTPTIILHDSASSVATAVVRAYTANPTLGNTVGIVRARKVFISLASGNTANADEMTMEFGARNAQPLILRGTSEVIAINLNGVTSAGNSFNISIEWIEE